MSSALFWDTRDQPWPRSSPPSPVSGHRCCFSLRRELIVSSSKTAIPAPGELQDQQYNCFYVQTLSIDAVLEANLPTDASDDTRWLPDAFGDPDSGVSCYLGSTITRFSSLDTTLYMVDGGHLPRLLQQLSIHESPLMKYTTRLNGLSRVGSPLDASPTRSTMMRNASYDTCEGACKTAPIRVCPFVSFFFSFHPLRSFTSLYDDRAIRRLFISRNPSSCSGVQNLKQTSEGFKNYLI